MGSLIEILQQYLLFFVLKPWGEPYVDKNIASN